LSGMSGMCFALSHVLWCCSMVPSVSIHMSQLLVLGCRSALAVQLVAAVLSRLAAIVLVLAAIVAAVLFMC
jgi:hypothetical protein